MPFKLNRQCPASSTPTGRLTPRLLAYNTLHFSRLGSIFSLVTNTSCCCCSTHYFIFWQITSISNHRTMILNIDPPKPNHRTRLILRMAYYICGLVLGSILLWWSIGLCHQILCLFLYWSKLSCTFILLFTSTRTACLIYSCLDLNWGQCHNWCYHALDPSWATHNINGTLTNYPRVRGSY